MRRRGSNFRILRPIAVFLAVTGLLGHGLAMLLVSLLTAPAAATDSFFLGEICAADGLVHLTGQPPGETQGGSEPHDTPIEGCPICTAFAQGAVADLPSVAGFPTPECCGAARCADHAGAAGLPVRSATQPRAPPARA